MYSTIKFNAGNDKNGNPRRVYVVFMDGEIVETYDEGHRGDSAIINRKHRDAYRGIVLSTTPSEYKELLKFER